MIQVERMKVEELVNGFYDELVGPRREFVKYLAGLESQIEGWFKLEFLYYLHKQGLNEFREESVVANGEKIRVDTGFESQQGPVYIELKHIITKQKENSFPVGWYFRDGFLGEDLYNLTYLPETSRKYILTFVSSEDVVNGADLRKQVLPALARYTSKKKLVNQHNLISYQFDPNSSFGYFLIEVFSQAIA